ncbi:MAG: tRNA (adenosine(37)-N6)-threonylcarbamoyltransferase complex dimerization subunit type 1 TsaB [Xanthomonadales bacterium]
MTRILAIETSTEGCSVALNAGAGLLERFERAPMKHAELILPFVRGVLAEAGWALGEIDVIAFGRGPGSFTSLRIGIGVVQGLAWGADLPVVPVSSLQAVAQAALESADDADPDTVLVAMDARMNEVFHATYRRDDTGTAQPLDRERVSAPSELSAPQSGGFIAAGNGFARYDELAPLAAAAHSRQPDLWPRAAVVLTLAQHWLAGHEPLPPEQAQPVYLRNTVAEKPSQQ